MSTVADIAYWALLGGSGLIVAAAVFCAGWLLRDRDAERDGDRARAQVARDAQVIAQLRREKRDMAEFLAVIVPTDWEEKA